MGLAMSSPREHIPEKGTQESREAVATAIGSTEAEHRQVFMKEMRGGALTFAGDTPGISMQTIGIQILPRGGLSLLWPKLLMRHVPVCC